MIGIKRPQSISKNIEDLPAEKRTRSVSEEPSFLEKKVLCDRFCWRCHKEGTLLECKVCPRSFHPRCDQQGSSQDSQWTCFECRRIMAAEDVDTRSPAMALLSVEQLRTLLKYAILRLKQSALIVFHNPVSVEEYPKYPEYIVHPMDLSQLEKNVRDLVYGSTEAFLADVKWILHNSIIFNGDGHRLTAAAKSVVNAAKQEMKEIEICPDCYLHAHTLKEKWFIEPCRRSHVLVWAKMKGYPYWPGKALRVANGNIDVRFFGAHDRAQVPPQLCFLLSYDMPQPLKSKKKAKFYMALEELEQHLQKVRAKLGGFEYAPPRTPLDLDKLYLQPISKVTTGRRHSDAEQSSQGKGRTVTIVTSSWMRKMQAEGHVKPPGKEKKEKQINNSNTENSKTQPSSRMSTITSSSGQMQGPQQGSSPSKHVNIKSEPKTKNSSERVNPPSGVFEISDRSLNIPKELDLNSASVNLNVTDLPDMEKHREFQSNLDKLQERILETFADESPEDESSQETEEQPTERKTPSSPPPNQECEESNLIQQPEPITEEHNSCENSSEEFISDGHTALNSEEWLKSKKLCAFSQRLGQTIESCKAKLGINEIEEEPTSGKTSDSDDDTSYEGSIDSESELAEGAENASNINEKESSEKQFSESEELVESEPPSKPENDVSVISVDVDDIDVANNVDVKDHTNDSLMEISLDEKNSGEPLTNNENTVDDGEPEKTDDSHVNSSGDEMVINDEKQDNISVTQNSENSCSEQLPNGLDHFDSASSGAGTFKETAEPAISEYSSEQRISPPPEITAEPQIDISSESDIANYAHKLIDFMKELGRDGGSNPQATIRSLELELEKQRWHHQQELVEIKHNTDLVLLEVRASLEIDKERALSELKRKHYIEKTKAIEELKKKQFEEIQQLEKEKARQIEEIKKKQWCANCQKEAIYYCCWNTSYCDYPCQQAHWLTHQESCGQLQGNNLMDVPQNKNNNNNNNLMITKSSVNSPQLTKTSAVQVQYMPSPPTGYQVMAPNVTLTPSNLPSRIPPTRNIVTIQAISRGTTNSTSAPLSKTYSKQ